MLSKYELTTQAACASLADLLTHRGWRLGLAESCTGGLLAAACTSRAGSSVWFDRGFVTYSNESKMELLGVPAAALETHGAVSEPVAHAMVRGVMLRAPVQVAVAVTGIAGPDGGTAAKPVGTVWLGYGVGGEIVTECQHFDGDRQAVRTATVAHALTRLTQLLQS